MSATETRELSKLIPKLEEADVKKIDDALSNQPNKMVNTNTFYLMAQATYYFAG